jgi:hypothetical protein
MANVLNPSTVFLRFWDAAVLPAAVEETNLLEPGDCWGKEFSDEEESGRGKTRTAGDEMGPRDDMIV